MAFIKIRGVLVDILVDVYKSYVSKDKKGVKQLLVQCQNALYGTMVASLPSILSQVRQKSGGHEPRLQPVQPVRG
jgi:hypothetical protein